MQVYRLRLWKVSQMARLNSEEALSTGSDMCAFPAEFAEPARISLIPAAVAGPCGISNRPRPASKFFLEIIPDIMSLSIMS